MMRLCMRFLSTLQLKEEVLWSSSIMSRLFWSLLQHTYNSTATQADAPGCNLHRTSTNEKCVLRCRSRFRCELVRLKKRFRVERQQLKDRLVIIVLS